jgi:hypothetical protein
VNIDGLSLFPFGAIIVWAWEWSATDDLTDVALGVTMTIQLLKAISIHTWNPNHRMEMIRAYWVSPLHHQLGLM